MTRRMDIVFGVLVLGLAALAVQQARMVRDVRQPQTPRQEQIAQRVHASQAGQPIVQRLPGRPGDIFLRSRHSYVLAAGSRQVPSCFVDPKLLRDEQIGPLSEDLARILGLDVYEVRRRILIGTNFSFLTEGMDLRPEQHEALTQLMRFDPARVDALVDDVAAVLGMPPRQVAARFEQRRMRRFGWIARQITRDQAADIQKLRVKAIGIQFEWTRDYPNGPIGSQIVGFSSADGTPGCGIHVSMRNVLEPDDGKRVMLTDARRRPIWSQVDSNVRPVDGQNVYLTIDAVVQEMLQTAVSDAVAEWGAKWGVGVVIDPQTGDVLAMVSAPNFDPNEYSTTPVDQMLNRAIAMPYEPGSVMKPIFVAAAIQDGAVTMETKIYAENGVYHAPGGGTIKDHGARYGLLSVWDAVVRSSNVVLAKIGEILGNDRLHAILVRWGFGQKTGIELPGESGGIVRPLARMDGYSLRRVPFGHEVSATALQTTMAFGAFANGGLLMKPRLVEQITDARGQVVLRTQPEAVRRVLSPSVAAQMLACLQDVVDNSHGTGKKARSSLYTMWGKTGTAQIPGPQGYIDDAYTGTFVAGAPFSNPRAICLISIYWPDRGRGYGGTVAAPAVKDVLEGTLRYLNIPPDKGTDTRSASVAPVGSQGRRFAGDL